MLLYKKKFKKGGILDSVKKIPKDMKAIIAPYITSQSKYNGKSGIVTYLAIPDTLPTSAKGLGFGADKNGFFVHTHRARSKSYMDPAKIPQKDIKFIESTG